MNPMWFMFALFLLLLVSVDSSQNLVKRLPGFHGDLPFTLQTGYIGVGESEIFYYLVESEGNPKDDPLILWTSGGPGCSALYAFIYEIGPLKINYANFTFEKPMLELNPYRWTKVANVLFVDQPTGTGFSYAKTPEAYVTNDTLSVMVAYHFLRKWLVDHPKFLNNQLYLSSNSYCGIVLPMLVQQVYDGNNAGEEPQINIKVSYFWKWFTRALLELHPWQILWPPSETKRGHKADAGFKLRSNGAGYMLGNALTDTFGDLNSRIPFAHRMGLLSDTIYKSTKENCDGKYLNVDPDNSLCIHDLQVVDKCLGRIRKDQILEPYCKSSNTLRSDLHRRDLSSLDASSSQFEIQGCRADNYIYVYYWANSRDVQEALHVGEVFNDIEWVRCNDTLHVYADKEPVSYTNNVLSSVGYHRQLADKNCRALVYSGDHDMVIPYMGTLNWIESLNLPVESDWRPWFVNEQVAGYTMNYVKNDYSLTFATVKGGGHTTTEYKPEECFHMFEKWISNESF